MLAYQNQDIKILENSFLAIPIEMAENTLCFQFKLPVGGINLVHT